MASVIEVEGVGEKYAAALQAAGVSTVEALLGAAGTSAGRKALAEATGLSIERILEWVNRADLMRVRGVGSEHVDLLEAAGVDTVRELARQRAGALSEKLGELNDAKRLVRRVPTATEVEKWVQEARALPAVVADGSVADIATDKSGRRSGTRKRIAPQRESKSDESEVVLGLLALFAKRRDFLDLLSEAAETFGSVDAALAWLLAPNRALGDATPASLLSKGSEGVAQARGILFRLEEGIFS